MIRLRKQPQRIHRFRRGIGGGVASALLALASAGAAAADTVALVADRRIDGRAARARADAVVLVEGDRIAAVGDRSSSRPARGSSICRERP